MIAYQVETTGIDAVLSEFNALPRQVETASRRAQAKAGKYAAGRLATLIGAAAGVPTAAIRRRVKTRMGAVWIGFNPLAASLAGPLKQEPAGAMAGAYFFQGAFVATMPTGYKSVFKRRGRPRFPLDEQGVALPQVPAIVDALRPELSERFVELFRQEMNYEVNVRGRT